jgi:hypothetical protein
MGGYIKEKAGQTWEGIKTQASQAKDAMDPDVPMTVSQMHDAAFNVAGAVTLPSIGGKVNANIAKIGFSQARRDVLRDVDNRIWDLEQHVRKLDPESPVHSQTLSKLLHVQAAREAYVEGFAAMPRKWTEPMKSVSGVRATDESWVKHRKGRERKVAGDYSPTKNRARFNMDLPVAEVIGHEFQHGVEQYIRSRKPSLMAKQGPRIKRIWARQHLIDIVDEDFAKRYNNRKALWKRPREWVATNLGREFMSFYKKNGRRMTTSEATAAYDRWQTKFTKILKRERKDLWDTFKDQTKTKVKQLRAYENLEA